MPTTSPEAVKSWMDVVQPAIGVALVAVLSFIAAYFARRKDALGVETPAGDLARAAVGAAFVDKDAGAAMLRIDQNVQALRDFAEAREARERDEDLLERAIEKLRQEGMKPPPRAR